MISFFESRLDYVYFFYGLGFVLMAQVCFSMRKSGDQKLPWVWLGLFSMTHGFKEWLEFVEFSFGDSTPFALLRLSLMALSYVFLTEFGRAGTLNLRGKGPGRWVYLPLLSLAALGGFAGMPGLNALTRYALGLVGGLWAAYALLNAFREEDLAGRGWLAGAGVSMLLYAIATGVVVPSAPFFPASSINTGVFFQTTGVPIQLVRGLLAFWSAIAISGYSRAACRKPSCAFIPVFATLAVLALGWFLTEATGKYAENEARHDLIERTRIGASGINPERVARLTGTPADRVTADFERLRAQLKAMCAANCETTGLECPHKYCRFVYLMGMKDGRLIFLVDAEPETSKDYSPPGQVYEDAEPYMFDDYKNARVTVQGPLKDAWGTWYSGVAPVLDKNGRVLAQLGMDVDAEEWGRYIHLSRIIGITTTLILCMLNMAVFTAWQRSRESSAHRAALQVAAARLENEKKLREITSALGEGLLVKDARGRLTFMNPEAERLLGWSEEELAGRDLHDIIHYQNADGTKKPLDECLLHKTLTTGSSVRDDMDVFTRKDGTIFPITYVTSPIMDKGKVAGSVTAFQDITERRRAEKEKDRLLKGISAITEGIAFADEKERYVYMNDAHARMFGYTPQELLGKTWRVLTPPETVSQIEGLMPAAMRDKNAGELGGEGSGLKKDGSIVPVEFRISALWDDNDGYEGHICIARDITERKRAEDALQRSNSLLNSLSVIQAHFIEDKAPKALFDEILNRLLKLTESEYGFISEVLFTPDNKPYLLIHAITDIAWDDETRSLYQKYSASGLEFYNMNTLFGEAVITGKPVISNDPASDTRLTGLPEGHPPLRAFMGLPFYRGDKLVGMVGIANCPVGYDEGLVDYLDPFLATCANIIEAYRNEQRRREAVNAIRAEHAFREAIENSTLAGISIVDLYGRQTYVNPAFCRMVGWSEEELVGAEPPFVYWPPEEAENRTAMLRKVINGAAPPGGREASFVRKNGERFDALLLISPLMDSHGKTNGWLGSVHDITERKRAEERLMLFSEAVEEAPDGIQIVGLDGRALYSNKAFEDIYGYSPEEFKGRHVDELNSDPGISRRVIIPSIMETGRWVGELMARHKEGREFPVLLAASIVKDGKGKPIAMVGIIRDLTERKNLERQRADFYAMITHDLKSPLTAILGYAELLLLEKNDVMDKDARNMVTNIRSSGTKLYRMVDDFMVVSRMESGNITLNESFVDMAELLAEARAEFEALARQKGLMFECEVAAGLPRAVLDKMHVQRAVSNLLQNAVNYTGRGGRVSLRAERAVVNGSDFILISVADTGPGISPEEKDKVFEKYYRSPKTSGIRGSGLGLAVVKSVAVAHGGKVELETAADTGSTFKLFLPVTRV